MSSSKRIEYEMVEVRWKDAEEHGEIGWNTLKDQLQYAKKPCPIMRSIGYCVHRNEDHISLLSSIGEKESSSIEKIPIAFVLEIAILKKTTMKKKKI
jgi:hypothetical protein